MTLQLCCLCVVAAPGAELLESKERWNQCPPVSLFCPPSCSVLSTAHGPPQLAASGRSEAAPAWSRRAMVSPSAVGTCVPSKPHWVLPGKQELGRAPPHQSHPDRSYAQEVKSIGSAVLKAQMSKVALSPTEWWQPGQRHRMRRGWSPSRWRCALNMCRGDPACHVLLTIKKENGADLTNVFMWHPGSTIPTQGLLSRLGSPAAPLECCTNTPAPSSGPDSVDPISSMSGGTGAACPSCTIACLGLCVCQIMVQH